MYVYILPTPPLPPSPPHTSIHRNGNGRGLYTLTFTIEMAHTDDDVYLAHCFPYTTADLHAFLAELKVCGCEFWLQGSRPTHRTYKHSTYKHSTYKHSTYKHSTYKDYPMAKAGI